MNLFQPNNRYLWLFVFLSGLFITSVVTAELISNKLIETPEIYFLGITVEAQTTIVGILPWPFVFLITDLLNEFYGKKVVKRLSWITSILILYCFFIVGLSLKIPAKEINGSLLADDASYNLVFGQTQMVILGSILAFLVSQLLDASIFSWIKSKTKDKFIWLRSTGSTVFSQIIDTYIVLYIGFVLPGSLSFSDFLSIAPTNYVLKLLIAILLTPFIYLGHAVIRRYLKKTN